MQTMNPIVYSCLKFDRSPSSVGMVPVNWFTLSRLLKFKFCWKIFCHFILEFFSENENINYRYLKLNFARLPSSVGIVPVNWLLLRDLFEFDH